MDAASQLRTTPIGRIEDRVVAKRNVSDRCVEEVFRKGGVFERFAMNVRIRVEFGGDASRNRVEFNAGAPRAWVQTFRHESEEMADTHGGFEDVPTRLESKPLHRLPDRLNDFWRSVMGIRRGGARRCELLGGENFPQFVGNAFPVPRRVSLKRAGHRAPAGVFHEYGLLFRLGETVFALDSLQRADCGEIRLRFLSQTAATDSVSVGYAEIAGKGWLGSRVAGSNDSWG